MKCWERLLMNCCAPFWRSWLRTCVSTNSSIGLGSRSRDAAYNEKRYISNNLIKGYISFKLILPSVSHVQQTEWRRQCALSPSHKLADSSCQHRTVSVVCTAQTSRAQDSAAIYLPECISVWNPSKPQHRSSLGNPYPSRFFFPFLCFIPKITQPTSRNQKLHFKT